MLLLLAALLYLIARIVAPLWQPIVWALLLGSLLAPLNARLAARLGHRPQLASGLTLLGAVLLFLLPLIAIAGAVAAQAAQLLQRFDASGIQLGSSIDLSRIPVLARPLAWLNATAGLSLEQLQGWLVAGTKRLLEVVAASGGPPSCSARSARSFSFVLMLFVLFFVLRDGPAFARKAVRLLPIEDRLRDRLWRHLIDVTRAVFMGIGLTAIVQGVLHGHRLFLSPACPRRSCSACWPCCLHWSRSSARRSSGCPAALWLVAKGHPGYAAFFVAGGVIVVGVRRQLPAATPDFRTRRSAYACRLHRRHGRPGRVRFHRPVPGTDRAGAAGRAVSLFDGRAGLGHIPRPEPPHRGTRSSV